MEQTNRAQTELKNFVPLPYRRVAVRQVAFPLTPRALEENLLGREAYRRTEFIVLRRDAEVGIARIERAQRDELFSPIIQVELFAAPEQCVWLDDSSVDVGIPSQLAKKARTLGLKADQTLIVHGAYEHVNFIYRPKPIVVQVVDVIPPEPAKLWTMASQVLAFAEQLPPIELRFEPINLIDLAREHPASEFLFPCQASGIDVGAPIYFLDTRPEWREWTMIGCERCVQFHRHFYGRDAEQVDYCPHKLTAESQDLVLTKCCLLETGIECEGNRVVVPWGATLSDVEAALNYLASRVTEPVRELQAGISANEC